MTGAVGNGTWTGVSLRDVLALAGVTADAVSALLVGLDADSPEGGWRRALPIEKALEPDTLLAYAMNGEVLPKDHGYPLRALVPGWVGSASVKWLGQIVVSAEPTLDTQQYELLRSHRGRLSAGRPSAGQDSHHPSDQERARAPLAR